MLTRKQFLRSALDVAAATLGLSVLRACGAPPPAPDSGIGETGSGGNTAGADADATPAVHDAAGDGAVARCIADGTTSTIGDNHGHVLVVTSADVAAAQAKLYNIQGSSNHNHTVALSAADFDMLQQDLAIMTTSSFDDGHDHSIMVACA